MVMFCSATDMKDSPALLFSSLPCRYEGEDFEVVQCAFIVRTWKHTRVGRARRGLLMQTLNDRAFLRTAQNYAYA